MKPVMLEIALVLPTMMQLSAREAALAWDRMNVNAALTGLDWNASTTSGGVMAGQ